MHTFDLKAITVPRASVGEIIKIYLHDLLTLYTHTFRTNEWNDPGPNPDLEPARRGGGRGRGGKARFLPYPPPDCNNVFRAVHKACNRYFSDAKWCCASLSLSLSYFSLFPVLRIIGYAPLADEPRGSISLFLLCHMRACVLVRAFITCAQPRRDKYR